MDWIFYTKIIAGVITVVILWMLIKELKAVVKRDKSGETSGKCELD